MLATDNSGVLVTPVPVWANLYPTPDRLDNCETLVDGGLCQVLRSVQVDLRGERPAHCVHLAHKVLTQEGAERIAQFRAEFDPRYQDLEVHFARVRRGENTEDYAKSELIDVLRREQNLERQVLNGHLTANLIIPDVRPGDLVEICWTLTGQNPVIGNQFYSWFSFAGPALSIRYRVLSKPERVLRIKTFGGAPDVRQTCQSDGVVERDWTAENPPRFQPEQLAPSWRVLAPSIQLSEARSWEEVASLFAPYYAVELLPASLAELTNEIRQRHPDDLTFQVRDLMRLIQDRIRYLSLSFGEGSLAPRSINEIWSTGYGDCKDATRLFVALAHHLAIDAVPALVTTNYGPAMDTFLPSATIFDHCIARVKLGDRSYWLDPTLRAKGPRLEDLCTTYFGWAITISADSGGLEQVPVRPPKLLMDVEEKIEFGPKANSPAKFDLTLSYLSFSADKVRNQIANEGLRRFGDRTLKRYESIWPGIEPIGELTSRESEDENRLTIVATYRIPKPWAKLTDTRVRCEVADTVVARSLAALTPTERKESIQLGIPRKMQRRLRLLMPKSWPASPRDHVHEAGGVRYKSALTVMGNLIEQDKELVVECPTSGPETAQAYSDLVDLMRKDEALVLSSEVYGNDFVQQQKSNYHLIWIFWLIAIVGWVLAQLSFADR